MGATLKEKASTFVGISEFRTTVTGENKGTILAAADVYVSDFGRVSMLATQQGLEKECLVYKPEYIKCAQLRKTQRKKLARNGDSYESDIIGEETLAVTNRKAIGLIADVVPA